MATECSSAELHLQSRLPPPNRTEPARVGNARRDPPGGRGARGGTPRSRLPSRVSASPTRGTKTVGALRPGRARRWRERPRHRSPRVRRFRCGRRRTHAPTPRRRYVRSYLRTVIVTMESSLHSGNEVCGIGARCRARSSPFVGEGSSVVAGTPWGLPLRLARPVRSYAFLRGWTAQAAPKASASGRLPTSRRSRLLRRKTLDRAPEPSSARDGTRARLVPERSWSLPALLVVDARGIRRRRSAATSG